MRISPLRLASLLALSVAAACASDVTTSPSFLADRSVASIADLPVSPSSLELRPGDVAQLTATPVNPQGTTVAQKSVNWSSTNSSVATVSDSGRVTAVAAGTTEIVVTRGALETRVPVKVDGCAVVPGGMTITGTITTLDCLFRLPNGTVRYGDYYRVTIPNGETQRFVVTSAIRLVYGIKADTQDPRVGLVHGSAAFPGLAFFRIVGNGDATQFFVSGQTATQLGAYSVTRTVVADAHDCNDYDFVMPGATFRTALSAQNSCAANISFSPFPDAIGKPILTHDYSVKLEAGHAYTFTLTGTSPQFNPAFTIFAYDASGHLVSLAQSVGTWQATRTLTVTVPSDRYVFPEIASGQPDGNGGWLTPSGTYTLSVSR